MNLSKSKLALAVASVLALGAAGQAQAGSYAGSYLMLDNLTINFNNGGPQGNVLINNYQFTVTNTATLNGVSAPTQTATCGPTTGTACGTLPGLTLDANPANAPGGSVVRTNNTFSFYGPGTNTYSNSDSVIIQSELTGAASTRTRQIAESEVQLSNQSGSANAEIQSTTGFTLDFVITGDVSETLFLRFDAIPFLRSQIAALNFLAGISQANVNSTFTLTERSTGDTVSWDPQGNSNNNCDSEVSGVTCIETADDLDLNRNLSLDDLGDLSFNPLLNVGSFGIDIAGLQEGRYTLSLNSVTSTQVSLVTEVPEPGSLALLGLGLAGLGLASYRRKQA